MKDFYHELKIGGLVAENNILLGPMAGVTDLPFRLLCHEHNAGIVCMEMVSAKAITYHNKKTDDLMRMDKAEHPVSLQLFGSEPEIMAKAVQLIEDKPYDILDINMGCPMPKITSNGDGSALMNDPGLIEKIVSAAVSATMRPVTVKLRKGYTDDRTNAVECALAAQSGGAAAVTIHGRTRTQMYSGKADWSIIADVKRALSIPVIGNGDVTDGESAEQMVAETGCDGVMVARAARGDPWIFDRIRQYAEKDFFTAKRPSIDEVRDLMIRHIRMQLEYNGEYAGIREMRKHIAWYTTGYPDSAKLRSSVNEIDSAAELIAYVDNFFKRTK